jgi:hypothetical protein
MPFGTRPAVKTPLKRQEVSLTGITLRLNYALCARLTERPNTFESTYQ